MCVAARPVLRASRGATSRYDDKAASRRRRSLSSVRRHPGRSSRTIMFGMAARYRDRFRFDHGTCVGVGRYLNFNARIEDVARSLKKISIAAALAGVLFVGTSSIPLAQQTDDVNELNKRVLELYRAGRYSDAIQIAQRVLAIREKALGRDHPDVATALNNLAVLYDNQGRYADAEPLLQRSLVIREKVLGRDHPDVATVLNNLAVLYESQGRYADAESLLQRSLDIREKVLGRDHPDVATSLNNLAELYR